MLQHRWVWLVAAIALLAIGAEVAVRFWNGSRGCVQVVNEVERPMDDLVVSYSGTKVGLGRLAPGGAASAWFSPAGRGTLSLEFKQNDNALKGFQLDDFDPAENRRTGSKLVLIVKNNRVERFMEADGSSGDFENLLDRIKYWLRPRL
jgi:hypothetical protein